MNKLCTLTLVSLFATAATACGDDDTIDDAGEHEHEGGAPHEEDGGDDEDLDASFDAG
jgi:hypothetical protein